MYILCFSETRLSTVNNPFSSKDLFVWPLSAVTMLPPLLPYMNRDALWIILERSGGSYELIN